MGKSDLSSILYASPFDPLRDHDGNITEDIFFNELFYKCDEFDIQEKRLIGLIDRSYDTRIIMIDGYSGIGKTTFIRSFIRRFGHRIRPILIDFHEHSITNNDPKNETSTPHPIKNFLKRKIEKLNQLTYPKKLITIKTFENDYLSNPILSVIKSYLQKELSKPENNDIFEKYAKFIIEKFQRLSPYFSVTTFTYIERYNTPELFKNNSHFILKGCDFNDTFLLLFTYLFFNKSENKKTVLFFDNLDAVHIDFLSDYFRNNLENTIVNISNFASDLFPDISFLEDYKFIFCLRDGNGAIINSHLLSAYTGQKERLEYRINYNPKVYTEIINLRIKYYKNINDNVDRKEDHKFLRFYEQINTDYYFREVFIPLYNADLRKITYVLHKILSNSKLLRDKPEFLLNFKSLQRNEKFLVRGTILYYILDHLRSDEFFSDYPFVNDFESHDDNGHINSPRSVLTVLTNLSGITYSRYINETFFRPSNVPLSFFLKKFPKIFSQKEIIDALLIAFRFHKLNWVNLVTFRNIHTKNSSDIYNYIKNNVKEIVKSDDISVNINPSAFVYLKYLTTHFEFFSILSNNKEPLFSLGSKKNENGYFKAITSIDNVYQIVSKHVKEIQKFYCIVVEGDLGMSRKSYRKSIMTFKHFGKGTPSLIGMGHTVRILTSIIPYIDIFRISVINELRLKNDDYTLHSFNKHIIKKIERFNNLFHTINDTAATNSFYNGFSKNIKKIKDSDYFDTQTQIGRIEYHKKYYNEHELDMSS